MIHDGESDTQSAETPPDRHSESDPGNLADAPPGEPVIDRDAWLQYRSLPSRVRPLHKLLRSPPRSALLWSLPRDPNCEGSRQLMKQLDKLTRKGTGTKRVVRLLEVWLAESRWDTDCLRFAHECLGWCHALPRLGQSLEAGPWCQLLDELVAVIGDSLEIDLREDPVAHQLVSGELPLSLSYLFPSIDSNDMFAESARQSLSGGIQDLLDGRGVPHGSMLPEWQGLLACWTRCRSMRPDSGNSCFTAKAEDEYQWLVHQSLRFMRYHGTLAFSAHEDSRDFWHLMKAAVRLSGDPADVKLYHELRTGRSRSARRKKSKGTASPSVHSPWAHVAQLRRNWKRKSPRLSVAYHDSTVHTELHQGKSIVWSGPSVCEVYLNGGELRSDQPWEEVCWFHDEEVDYLELERPCADGWKIGRQLLLARKKKDRFLLIADSVQGDQPSRIDYRSVWPLTEGVGFDAAAATREGVLYSDRRLARVLPLGLPEWRSEQTDDWLTKTTRGLELRQHVIGRRLFAALFVDLKPTRFGEQLTWRQLTVGHQLQAEPGDVAVGFRVRVGRRQWLIYRSLAERANRTVLGQNLTTEFLMARFLPNGETKQLLQVE